MTTPSSAEVFIQWKGTDVCLDWTCPCGDGGGHYDGHFAYGLQCEACGRKFKMPSTVTITEVTDDDPVIHSMQIADAAKHEPIDIPMPDYGRTDDDTA